MLNDRVIAAIALLSGALLAQTAAQPVRAVTDPGVITTRQAITPAGVPSIFDGRVYGVAWGREGDLWVLHATQVYRLDWRSNQVKQRIPLEGSPGMQSLTADRESGVVYVGHGVQTAGRGPAKARLSAISNGSLKPVVSSLGSYLPGSIGLAGQRVATVPLVWENKLAVIDIEKGSVVHLVDTGIAPFAAVTDRAGTMAYVSNLGGRPPRKAEAFASPMQKPLERIAVDARGIAASGTVTRVDLASGKATHSIAVGLHPTAMAWDEGRHRLYVANGNSDTVSVVDTQTNAVAQTISLQAFSEKIRGIAPTALALSPDGKKLYVACGGINAVAVVDALAGTLSGMIPTGWYPNGVAMDASGKHLAISSLLGAGSGWRDAPAKRFVHSYRGSIAVVEVPDRAQLAGYTTAVAENNHLRLAGAGTENRVARAVAPIPVPERSGEASPIEHVVFIIKENRTYDQVLGDMSKGNGDPSLTMFGKDITSNQHKMADDFVLFDNFYATGGNSADGHQWLTQANETEYCLWPGYQGRSYPYDGSDPMAYSSGGFLWDYALARGRSVKVYGEFAGRMAVPAKDRLALLQRWRDGADFSKEWSIRAPIEPLNRILAAHYPSYSTAIPDVARAQIFLKDLNGYEAAAKLPNLILLQLPSNHTYGASAGLSTPQAMVADNDLALGQIVEALTHSRFWPKMAIFIVEDDAQNGVDHVDGHRTTAFVVSPYARRAHIDSTFYSHQSMLKTIELMLGLPTMSLFDLIANDMRNSFTNEADLRPFSAETPKQNLFELNPEVRALAGKPRQAAIDSAKMNWSVPDAAPTDRVNQILWGQIKGWNTPYPAPRSSVFSPLSLDVDDEEREAAAGKRQRRNLPKLAINPI